MTTRRAPAAHPDGAFGPEARGPIIGVYSTSCDDSIKIYEGRTRYCDWRFVLQEGQPQQGPGGNATPGPQLTPVKK